MKFSLAAKLLFGGAATYALGSVIEKAASPAPLPPQRKWHTIENSYNLLSDEQVADIHDYADENGLTFYEALQAYCDHWNGL